MHNWNKYRLQYLLIAIRPGHEYDIYIWVFGLRSVKLRISDNYISFFRLVIIEEHYWGV